MENKQPTVSITEFKKCIIWHKRYDTWSGSFSIPHGCGFSANAMPHEMAKTAKPSIIEMLFKNVTDHCQKYGIDLNMIIKQILLAKSKKKA